MAKIVLTSARDIALDKLVASDVNVRRIKAGVSVEDLAEDIARRGLLQSLNVRPELDGEGAETGRFTVTAGGRRLAALKLLVKQKRLAKNAPVPCIVKADGIEEEDFLAENTMREALASARSVSGFRAAARARAGDRGYRGAVLRLGAGGAPAAEAGGGKPKTSRSLCRGGDDASNS